MSKFFTAINRKTGKQWKPKQEGEFLVMYDSGFLAVATSDHFHNYVIALDNEEWKLKVKSSFVKRMERFANEG